MSKILFLSPHTDDAELGSGGTIAKLATEHEVHVIAFSDANGTQPPEVAEGVLVNEMMEAMSVLGVDIHNVRVFDFHTRNFDSKRQKILDTMIEARNSLRPSIVFVPSTHDHHQDHQVVVNEARRAFKSSPTTILGYEQPWNNFSFVTTTFVKLDRNFVNKKVEALKQYRSQCTRPYLNEEFILGLAAVRGVQIGAPYAEAFETIRIIMP